LASHSLTTLGSAIEDIALFVYLLYERISEGQSFLCFFRFVNDEINSRVDVHHPVQLCDPVCAVVRDVSFDDEQIDVVDVFFSLGRGSEQDDLFRLVLFDKLVFDVVDLF
jgi:hypothetical protein